MIDVKRLFWILGLLYLAFAGWWVVSSGVRSSNGDQVELLNVACDPTRELWKELNSLFVLHGKSLSPILSQMHVTIRQSHGGSGSQARSVRDGLPADVVTLALWSDTDQLCAAGLIDDGWEDKFPRRSLPFVSTIVFVVRKDNPKSIRDWPDLNRSDVVTVVPNPKTSGNGKWAYLAIWGAAVRTGGTPADADRRVADVFRRVPVLDTSARGASLTFAQKNIGDVHLTWENEARLEVAEANGALTIVYPPRSILAEPHVAVVDAVARRKNTTELAKAYLDFLYTPAAQEVIAKHHYRPTDDRVKAATAHLFEPLELYSVRDLGLSWPEVTRRFFADGAAFDGVFADGASP